MTNVKRGRKPREFDKDEVDEIILSKLDELGGIRKKLNYYGVWKHNEELANDPTKYKRKNGESFNLYGYDFWAGNYGKKDAPKEPYFGKKRIDEIKSNSTVIIAGEEYTPDMQDLKVVVDEWCTKPIELSRRVCKLFQKDRDKISRLENERIKDKKKIEDLEKQLELFERGFASLFLNSSLPYNSLENVMVITKSNDSKVRNDLLNMFNGKSNLNRILSSVKSSPKSPETLENVISILDTQEVRKKRRSKIDEGL